MLEETESRWTKAGVLGVTSGALYVVSFVLPVGRDLNLFGWQAFLWSAFIYWYWPMWLANPAIWFGLVKARHRKWDAARNAGLAAIALTCSEAWMFLPDLGVGFYCWFASMVALTAAGVYGSGKERRLEVAVADRPAVPDTSFVGDPERCR